MTLTKTHPILFLALAFAAGIAFFTALNRTGGEAGAGAGAAGPAGSMAAHPRTTDQQIAALQAAVRAHPRNSGELVLLADAYMQKVRETGDAGFYRRAEGVLAIAHRLAPRDSAVYTGLGTLALARHDFRSGLAYGRRAQALAPALVRPLGVLVDGQVELGRYRDAGRTLQRM